LPFLFISLLRQSAKALFLLYDLFFTTTGEWKSIGMFSIFHLYHVAVVNFSDYKIHPLIKFETMDIAVFHWTK